MDETAISVPLGLRSQNKCGLLKPSAPLNSPPNARVLHRKNTVWLQIKVQLFFRRRQRMIDLFWVRAALPLRFIVPFIREHARDRIERVRIRRILAQ